MLEAGTIVKSIAGHDKQRFYVVVEANGDKVKIADGKVRKLESPKIKNLKHLRITHKKVDLDSITSNKALKGILEPMNQSLQKSYTNKGGN